MPWVYWMTFGLAAIGIGCSSPTIGKEAGGDGGDDDLKDGDETLLRWPQDSLRLPGASAPDLALTAGGTMLIAYLESGRVRLAVDPIDGAGVLDLGPGASLPPRLVVSDQTEQAVVLWSPVDTSLYGAWIDQGELDGSPFELVSQQGRWALEWKPSRGLKGIWTAAGPVVLTLAACPEVEIYDPSGELVERQFPSSDWFAFAVPRPEAGALPVPPEAQALFGVEHGVFLGFGETASLLDLDGSSAGAEGPSVLAVSNLRHEPVGGGPPGMWWAVARRGAGAGWFSPGLSGVAAMPGEAAGFAWLQVHPLGPDQAVLTWCQASGGLVFDVFMTRLERDADGTPSPDSDAINVSQTYGLTEHSEFPIVLPAGGGRLWVTWRESYFGPRVALYDAGLSRLAIAAPEEEYNLNGSAPMGAAVDAQGALWLAAQVEGQAGQPEVRLWRIEHPSVR